jgi:hypothetical protein
MIVIRATTAHRGANTTLEHHRQVLAAEWRRNRRQTYSLERLRRFYENYN